MQRGRALTGQDNPTRGRRRARHHPIAHAQSRCDEHPWCDASLSPDARADLLLAQLTLPEKSDLLWGDEQFGVANPSGGRFHTGKTPATRGSASRT